MLIHQYSQLRRPKRVVVLGASGFLGQALLRRMKERQVEAVSPSSRELDLTAGQAPQALAALLRPTDSVVMFAATKPGRHHDEQAFVANVTMAASVCSAVREAKCEHLVYISSEAVYPFVQSSIREDLGPLPVSLYGLMHFARETMLQGVEGIPVAILRLAQVYGIEDPHGAYGPKRMVTSALSEGRIVLYGTGEEMRDHVNVEDVAALVFDVLGMRSHGTINVACGRSVSFAKLAEIVREACHNNVMIEREPRRVPVTHRQFDTSALNLAFPEHRWTSLESGIANMVQHHVTAQNGQTTICHK